MMVDVAKCNKVFILASIISYEVSFLERWKLRVWSETYINDYEAACYKGWKEL